jgi:hypothetical protein
MLHDALQHSVWNRDFDCARERKNARAAEEIVRCHAPAKLGLGRRFAGSSFSVLHVADGHEAGVIYIPPNV